jgi:hypothetical protein
VVIAHAGMNARTVVLRTAEQQKFFSKYGTAAFIRQAPVHLAGMSALEASIDIRWAASTIGPTPPSG